MRAAQVLLFAGGLMVLGFVLGGQAQAAEQPGAAATAERVPDAGRTAESTKSTKSAESAESAATRGAEPASKLSESGEPVEPVGGAVAERVVEPVVRTAVQPVEQALAGAVQGVGRGVEQAVPERPLPEPSLPEWPGAGIPAPAPTSPEASAPGPASTPVQDLPQTAAAPADGHGDDPRAAVPAGAPAYEGTYAGPAAAVNRTHVGPALGGRLPLAPGRAPAAPGGCAVAQTAGDGHTHRGDLHGAWFQDAVEFGLVPGSRRPGTGTGVRERHRDILEFPG
ncbi:hypothetical protein [Streptomyces formicae]|uniref:hypothetical protein n=1 Tax=Streptomyces formicae TaxID=1616117 RepID=UPI0036D2DB53